MSVKIEFKGLKGSNPNLVNAANPPIEKLPTYESLKREYDLKKREFDAWCEEHQKAAQSEIYTNYVKDFNRWEVQMLSQIQDALKKKIDVPQEDEIGGDIYAQLNNLLTKCTRYEFILAFLHAKSVDPSLFTTVCQSLNLDNASTSKMPIYPINMRAALAANPPQLFHTPHGTPTTSQYAAPQHLQPIPPSYSMPDMRPPNDLVFRQDKMPLPPRTYAEKPKLPFFDIGKSR